MRGRSLILDTTVRLVFDAALVLSVYLLFAGHNQPGGGFVGGLVAAGAIGLRYVAGGRDDVVAVVPVRPWLFPSAGLALAAATALWPLVVGDAPLDQRAVEVHVALLGDVKLTTATVFDTGVYLIVVGLVLMVVEGLGDEPGDEVGGGGGGSGGATRDPGPGCGRSAGPAGGWSDGEAGDEGGPGPGDRTAGAGGSGR